MARGEEGIIRYTFQGQEKIMVYALIKTTGWSTNVAKARGMDPGIGEAD